MRLGTVRWRWLLTWTVLSVSAIYWVGNFWTSATIGNDAHIYYRGAAAWLTGGDPWATSYRDLHFAAPPWVLPLIAPLALLGEGPFVAISVLLAGTAAVYIVRKARLPLGWLAFGPLVSGILNGNPIVVAIALAMAGIWPLALLVRPQLVPAALVQRRWLAVLVTALLAGAGLLLVPWGSFLLGFSRYAGEGDGGIGTGSAIMLGLGLVSIVGLAIVDLKAAGLLATIVLMPANGWYSGIAALPVIHPILALGLAFPIWGMPTVTVAAYAAWRLEGALRPPRSAQKVATQAVGLR